MRPDVISFNAAIKACEVSHQAEQALGLLELMQMEGVKPDHITLNTLIDACGKAGDAAEALRLFYDMDRIHGLTPDAASFGTTIEALYAAGDLDRGHLVYSRGVDAGFYKQHGMRRALQGARRAAGVCVVCVSRVCVS